MIEKTLYLECYSGISGDMTVAALLDLGADQKVLMEGLNSLKVDGYKIVIGKRSKNSIEACDFDVVLVQNEEYSHTHNENDLHEHNHDHAIEHDHSHMHIHENNLIPDEHGHNNMHEHAHGHDHGHTHNHELVHEHSHVLTEQDHNHSHAQAPIHLGHHEHRNLHDIYHIIDGSAITPRAKELAKRIFHIVAVAEATAHGKSIDEVHFHEVGAIDSIVDIVAVAICLDNLNITDVIVSELYEGTGTITCQHGVLPIPVPAVINISAAHKLPLHITNVKGELVTPTGAAIVAAIKTKDSLPKEMIVHKIGLGAGKRNYANASGILRALLIEDTSNISKNEVTDTVWVLEANIDDCTGEALGIAMEQLLQNGAKDVYYSPIYMKKNRPAYLLGVICTEDLIPVLEGIIFTHTTTIGVRKHPMQRTILNRKLITIATPYGDAVVKVCSYQDKTFFYPECDSLRTLCKTSGKDYSTMYHEISILAQDSYHN